MNAKSLVAGLLFFLAVSSMSGCVWIDVPRAPAFKGQASIPLKVGVQLNSDPVTALYGPQIIGKLQAWNVFESVTYEGSGSKKIDAVLALGIRGTWTPDSSNALKGFLIGLTLYSISPAVGPGMTGRHDLEADLRKGSKEVAKYNISQETHVSFGLYADANEVGRKADEAQVEQLAYKLAEAIKKDWPRISSKFKTR